MRIDVLMFPTDRAIAPGALATAVEERGFNGVWFPEHTHMPVDHSAFPAGGDLPDHYRRTHDLFVAMTAAAAATSRIRIGSGICLVAQHHPLNLAKAIASIDHLSGGRVDFGIGYGWNRPEAEHHGVAFADRRDRVGETIRAVKRLWTREVASFEGEHVRFGPSWSWPKPVQDPHPPVLLGAGIGPRTLEALVDHCDGWLPLRARDLDGDLARIRRALEEAGRDPDAFEVVKYGARPDRGHLERLAASGVDRVGFWVDPADEPTVIERLDRLAALLPP